MSSNQTSEWWLSSGPPQPEKPSGDKPESKERDFLITPEVVQAGLNMASGFVDGVTRILSQSPGEVIHDVRSCGVCPICVTLNDIKKFDPELATLFESALQGVTHSYEKLKSRLPELMEPLSKVVVESLVQSFLKGRFS
ncbi:MAG: hypothetical protein ACO3P3_00690 [Candidatus Nanopelagicales bacterium]